MLPPLPSVTEGGDNDMLAESEKVTTEEQNELNSEEQILAKTSDTADDGTLAALEKEEAELEEAKND